jgi:hypothetical protein
MTISAFNKIEFSSFMFLKEGNHGSGATDYEQEGAGSFGGHPSVTEMKFRNFLQGCLGDFQKQVFFYTFV